MLFSDQASNSDLPLCHLCVLCVSVVDLLGKLTTETQRITEEAQSIQIRWEFRLK